MKPYKNLHHDSGVTAYENGDDFIIVQFAPNKNHKHTIYIYTNNSAGASHITEMKKLADIGHGLNSYINKHKPKYASKK